MLRKKLTRTGTSNALVIDKSLMQAAGFAEGQTVDVEASQGELRIRIAVFDLHDHEAQQGFEDDFWQNVATPQERWEAAWRLAIRAWPLGAERLDRVPWAPE